MVAVHPLTRVILNKAAILSLVGALHSQETRLKPTPFRLEGNQSKMGMMRMMDFLLIGGQYTKLNAILDE
jgi:hypothetical protein